MKRDFKILMALMRLDIGGAETHVLELCKALKRSGVDVCVASNGGAYVSELAALGIRHFHVPMHNKHIGNLFTSYLRLGKIIKSEKIRLVHAHGRIPAFLCGLLKRQRRFRFVTTAHLDFKTNFPYNILSDWGEKSLAVSPDIKEYLIKSYGMRPEDILITVNGVDTDRFSPDAESGDIIFELGLSESTLKIVSVSRMDADRSLAARRLIECAAAFCAYNPQTEIIIVGGGNDFAGVQAEAEAVNKKLGRKVITLTGNRVDIEKFVALADIYVNVSRSVLEAMSAGKACIVAGNQGYIGIFGPDVLEACKETNFCCRGCGETTAALIERDVLRLMAMTPQERAVLGAYAREVILADYSLDKMARDSMELYDLCLRKETDILISGYYGFKNNGDEAVLKSIIDSLLAADPGLKISVLSMRPRLTAAAYAVKAINRYNLPLIWRELRRTRLLITGGGSLIQDVTSTRSLFYYLFIIEIAIKLGAKTMLFANGIGPLRTDKNKALTGRILNKTDLITVRDERSVETLRELNVTVPVHLTADIAFSLAWDKNAQGLKSVGVDGKYFCISIRNWKNLKFGFEREIAAFASSVAKNYGLTPVFISMQPANDDDISRRTLALMESGCFFGSGDLTEMLCAISGAEFMLGMRLHTVVYAAKAGVPVIGLVYDPKVRAMMELLGQDFCMDVEEIDRHGLDSFAAQIIASRAEISTAISAAAAEVSKRALYSTELALELVKERDYLSV